MAKGPQDPQVSSRKRQLNVVYFVDSSRTRSFRLPLARVNLLLTALAALVVWSIASIALLFWIGEDRRIAGERFKTAMATIFEFETRYGGAFEAAYPLDSKGQPLIAAADQKMPSIPEVKPASPLAASKSHVAGLVAPAKINAITAAVVQTNQADEPEEVGEEEAGPVMPKASDAPAVAAVPAVGNGQSTTNTTLGLTDQPDKIPAAAAKADSGPPVTVDNPVLEPGTNTLELRFDLKSKVNTARAEGYVWAIAEFKTDKGKTVYIGAPPGIGVKPDGEPANPKKANKFAVRFFKRKKFSFPMQPPGSVGEPGTFVGIRIGVTGNSGNERMIYKVPISIRSSGGTGATKESVPKTNPG